MKFQFLKDSEFLCRNISADFFSGVSVDSRDIPENYIFCALKGEHSNGHAYVERAIENGASAAIIQKDMLKESWKDLPLIIVDDPLQAIQKMAADFLKSIQVPVFAITGSVGKTSTRRLLYHVLSPHMAVHQTLKNFNNQIGLPLSILSMKGNEDLVILEMGASYAGDIKDLCQIAEPKYAILTAIAHAHMGKFGSIDIVQKTKFELYDAVLPEGILFMNMDDKRVAAYPSNNKKRISYSIETPSDYKLDIVDCNDMGCLTLSDGKSRILLKTPGQGAAINAAAVYAVAMEFNIPYVSLVKSIKDYMPEKGRGYYETWNDILIVDDTYNANPASCKNAILSLEKVSVSGKKYFIFADMLEMGATSRSEHEKIGRSVAQAGIDTLYCYGPESLFTVKAAQEAGLKSAHHFMDKQELGQTLIAHLRAGDAVHLKGSRGMAMETIITQIKDQ